MIREMNGEFFETYDPTISTSNTQKRFCMSIGSQNIEPAINIIDTSGPEEFSAIRTQIMETSRAFIIVFSLTSLVSWEEVEIAFTQIQRARERYEEEEMPAFPVIICGYRGEVLFEFDSDIVVGIR